MISQTTDAARLLAPAEIITAVAVYYSVDQKRMLGPECHKSLVKVRHIAMYLVRDHTKLSLAEIGREFGNRDHTTVMNALKRVEFRLAVEVELQGQIRMLREQLGLA